MEWMYLTCIWIQPTPKPSTSISPPVRYAPHIALILCGAILSFFTMKVYYCCVSVWSTADKTVGVGICLNGNHRERGFELVKLDTQNNFPSNIFPFMSHFVHTSSYFWSLDSSIFSVRYRVRVLQYYVSDQSFLMAMDSVTTLDQMKYCLSPRRSRVATIQILKTWQTDCVKVSWISKLSFLPVPDYR